MKPRAPVYVVGGGHSRWIGRHHPDFVWRGHPDHGRRDNPDLAAHLGAAVRAAFEDSGAPPEAVDRSYVGNFIGELTEQQGHLGALLASLEPALDGKPCARIEGACASGGLALVAALEALQAGHHVALVCGVERQSNVGAAAAADHLARAAHYATERPHSAFVFPWLFALRARAYKAAAGIEADDLLRFAALAYDNARDNPSSHMGQSGRDLARLRDDEALRRPFLEDPTLAPHLTLADCSQLTDGASAVVLATDEGLRRLGADAAACSRVVAWSQRTASLTAPRDPCRLTNTAAAVRAAYADAAITPADVGVAEVHDCFTIAGLQMLEALGLADEGGAAALVRDGRVARSGDIPINPGGGLIGFGHPVGATGVKQIVELHRQLRGEGGATQIARRPAIGVAANMGGDDRTAVVTVLR